MSTETNTDIRDRHVNVLLHEVSLLASKLFNRQIRDVGLTRTQWHVLYLLHENDGLSQTELADHLTMTKPSLGHVVDRLVEGGWVERAEDVTDRRVKRVYLTEKIGPHLKPLEQIVEDLGNATTKGLTQAQKKSFAELLAIAYENLLAVNEQGFSDDEK